MGSDHDDVPLVCIVGGPRTGTHLLNSLLCTSPGVLPLLSESAPAVYTVRAFRSTVHHVGRFPGVYFDDVNEVAEVYGQLMGALVHHLRARYESEICVFRTPLLTHYTHELRTLARAAGLTLRIICLVRDPRDVVASMRVWNRRQTAAGGRPLIKDADAAPALARWFCSYYDDLWLDDPEDVLFLRYEDVVRQPDDSADRINEFTGLSIDPAACARGWSSARTSLTPDDPRVGVAITPLYNSPISAASIGRWGQELSDAEAHEVLKSAQEITGRFYPELHALARAESRAASPA